MQEFLVAGIGASWQPRPEFGIAESGATRAIACLLAANLRIRSSQPSVKWHGARLSEGKSRAGRKSGASNRSSIVRRLN
jgi:hypothetical protein